MLLARSSPWVILKKNNSTMYGACLTISLPVSLLPQVPPNLGYKLRQEMSPSMCTFLFWALQQKSYQEDLSSQKSEDLYVHWASSIFTLLFSSLPPDDFSSSYTSMTPWSLLLSVLVLLTLVSTVSTPMCSYKCCVFVEGFPVRLKKLREDLSQIRDHYVSN